MKKPNQIRRSSAKSSPRQPEKPAVKSGRAQAAVLLKLGRLIKEIDQIQERYAVSRGLIPAKWELVAMIDFHGVDRSDCEGRTIYKLPDGRLKALRQSTGEPDVIEDVTRPQVVQWLLTAVIPEEFQSDFRSTISKRSRKPLSQQLPPPALRLSVRESPPVAERSAPASLPRFRRPILCRVNAPLPTNTPKALRAFWKKNVARAPWFDPMKEHLVTVILDTRYRAIAYSLVSVGSLNECLAHPRDILRPVIDRAGYAFVVMHNHPSGVASPSVSDHAMTRRIAEAAELLQLKFLDHVIVGAGRDYFSFCEAGVIDSATGSVAVAAETKKEASDRGDAFLSLEDSVHMNAALLETLARAAAIGEKYGAPTDEAASGMIMVATRLGGELRVNFNRVHALTAGKGQPK